MLSFKEEEEIRIKHPEAAALGGVMGCVDNLKHHRDIDRFLAEVAEVERIYRERRYSK